MSGRAKRQEKHDRDMLLTRAIARMGELDAAEARANAEFAESIKAFETERDSALRTIGEERRDVVAHIVAMLESGGKRGERVNVKLPSGEVTLATSGTALEVTDASEFMRLARLHRMVTRVSTLKPRVINKTALKGAIENFPRFYRRVSHLLVQPKQTILTVKPRNYETTVKVVVREETVPYPAPKPVITPKTPRA